MPKCVICDTQYDDSDTLFTIGLDKPYLNLKVHRNCYMQVRDSLKEFLLEHWDRVDAYIKAPDSPKKRTVKN
jgi:hypothetical protein